jgi:hypothetical protein
MGANLGPARELAREDVMLVRQVVDPKLAQFAYLIACPRTGEAVVIDSERDMDRYFENPGPISSCGVGTKGSLEGQSI